MTASKAMTALGLMNARAVEHPITGTQYLQEKVARCIFFFLLCLLSDERSYLFLGKQETELYKDTRATFRTWKAQCSNKIHYNNKGRKFLKILHTLNPSE